jgi:hypothetical protein
MMVNESAGITIMNHYRNLSNVYLHNKANGNRPEELQKSL